MTTKSNVLARPLTRAELRNACDPNGCLQVAFSISLDQLIDGNLDDLNDYAEDQVCADDADAMLSDLSYRVVDYLPANESFSGGVILSVAAAVEFGSEDDLVQYRVAYHESNPEDTPKLLNHYTCPDCAYTWTDTWDSEVEDDCPRCGARHITPKESEELERPVAFFACWADDVDHAREQCLNAYPLVDIVGVVPAWLGQLKVGDPVQWNDPDNDLSSGMFLIVSINSLSGAIESDDNVVALRNEAGSEAEVFPGELSQLSIA